MAAEGRGCYMKITNFTPKGFGAVTTAKTLGPVVAPKPRVKSANQTVTGQVGSAQTAAPPAAPAAPAAAGMASGHGSESVPPPAPPLYTSPGCDFNSQSYTEIESFPPPPPLDLCSSGQEGGDVEVAAPSSPVSSSYSELRNVNRQCAPHLPPPPPPHPSSDHLRMSQLNVKLPSRRSEPVAPSGGGATGSSSTPAAAAAGGLAAAVPASERLQEACDIDAELNSLTRNLVLAMDTPEENVHGLCTQCDQVVSGDSGCSAMGRVYHSDCFRCVLCRCVLHSQPFYLVDRRPHCHACYLTTLEKCSVCAEPVTGRMLRATGKLFHPGCFVCHECGVSLDGVQFTVDSSNNAYCITDFHNKFAPKCSVCHLPIVPEPGQDETVRVVVLDRSFHVQCYKCEDCELVLSSEAEGRGCYPLDGAILCKQCNGNRVRSMTTTH